MSGSCSYRPDVRVRLIGIQPFFGPGTAQLLRFIQQWGSVAAACERMQMSYSKGRAMLRQMERELGCPVVRRSKGGVGGGSAVVMPAGKRLLETYTRYEEKICDYARSQFDMLQASLPSDLSR